MYPLTVSQLNELINGKVLRGTCGNDSITGGEIDSRRIRPGHVFFALGGARTHGLTYSQDVSISGAACIILDRNAPASLQDACLRDDKITVPLIQVDDSKAALWTLAKWNRQQSAAVLIGVTGSVGKTTTRQLIHRVLSGGFDGIESPASFNNDLGVPLSLLLLEPHHEFGVLELGANAPGEIQRLAELVSPEISVITRVAEAHLEGFGDLDGVQKAKQELVEETQSSGMVFLNADDPRVLAMQSASKARVLTYGAEPHADFRFANVKQDACGIRVMIGEQTYAVPGAYHHLSGNIAAAVAVGQTLGLTQSVIQSGLDTFQVPTGRGNVVPGLPWTVVDDSYNASPASVNAAARALSEQTTSGHRILVLGDMLELGSQSIELHHELGLQIARHPIDHVLIFGNFAEYIANGIRSGLSTKSIAEPHPTETPSTNSDPQSILPLDRRFFENHVSVYRDISTLCTMLECLASEGDVIWVKGSRGSAMERVVQHLVALSNSISTPRRAA